MGTDMIAFIEYDKESYYRIKNGSNSDILELKAFSDQNDTYSLTEDGGLYTGSKDYLFFGAIAGVRNEKGIEPLYAPRGLPPNLSLQVSKAVRDGVFDGGFATSWLTLREISSALDHQKIDRTRLSFETQIHLNTMANMEIRLGSDRVRFVFTFE